MSATPIGSRGKSLQRWGGYLCIGLGLLLILSSFQSGWGKAYGQSVITPTPAIEIGDPQISKTGAPGCCYPGDTVTWNIVITNVGTGDVTGVLITDTLPAQLQLVQVTTTKGQVTVNGNYFEVRIGRISPGEIVTIVVISTVLEGIPDDTTLLNTTYLRSDQGDRQASAEVVIRVGEGACETPPILPPTGGVVPQAAGSPSLWLLLVGISLLLLGIVLTLRSRKRSEEEA